MRSSRHRTPRGRSFRPLAASVSLVCVLFLVTIVGVISRRTLPENRLNGRETDERRAGPLPGLPLDGRLSASALESVRPPSTSAPQHGKSGHQLSQQVSTSVYYAGKYWNDIPAVRQRVFHTRASGSPSVQLLASMSTSSQASRTTASCSCCSRPSFSGT